MKNNFAEVPTDNFENVPIDVFAEVPTNDFAKVPIDVFAEVPTNDFAKVPTDNFANVPTCLFKVGVQKKTIKHPLFYLLIRL